MLERNKWLAINKRDSQEGVWESINREERRPSCFQTYQNRHINDAKRNDDDDEDWSGRADHDKGADYRQEVQNPAAQGRGEGVIHRGNILETHNKERWYTNEFLQHFTFFWFQQEIHSILGP